MDEFLFDLELPAGAAGDPEDSAVERLAELEAREPESLECTRWRAERLRREGDPEAGVAAWVAALERARGEPAPWRAAALERRLSSLVPSPRRIRSGSRAVGFLEGRCLAEALPAAEAVSLAGEALDPGIREIRLPELPAPAWPRLSLFDALAPESHAALAQAARLIEIADGECLARTGDPAEHLWIVACGGLEAAPAGPGPGPPCRAEAGDSLGLGALLGEAPWPGPVRSRGETALLELDGRALGRWLQAEPAGLGPLLAWLRARVVRALFAGSDLVADALAHRVAAARWLELEDGARVVGDAGARPAALVVVAGQLEWSERLEDGSKRRTSLLGGDWWRNPDPEAGASEWAATASGPTSLLVLEAPLPAPGPVTGEDRGGLGHLGPA